MSEKDPAGASWHLDKRIPVSLIFTMLVQTGVAVWWARGISSAQEQSVIDRARLEARVDRIEADRDDMRARVIRIEEKISSQNDVLQQQNATLHEILREVQSTGQGDIRRQRQ
ncbi:hypothetical protein M1D80_11760 [Phyllobacteriaceae bacterium JZ32]